MSIDSTEEEIYSLLDSALIQECCFWEQLFVSSYKLPCGFVVNGLATRISSDCPLDDCRKAAREDAANKLLLYEVYRKQSEAQGK